MRLKNAFPQEVRELWRDTHTCQLCGENGEQNGGLELHHITGRDSKSVLNGTPLCKLCHAQVGHTKEEEQFLYVKALARVCSHGWIIDTVDYQFLEAHEHLQLHNNGYMWDWLMQR